MITKPKGAPLSALRCYGRFGDKAVMAILLARPELMQIPQLFVRVLKQSKSDKISA
jgi:hypothetical protein